MGSPTDVDVGGLVDDVGAVLLELDGFEVVGLDVPVVGVVGTSTDGDVDEEAGGGEDGPVGRDATDPEVGTVDTGAALEGNE